MPPWPFRVWKGKESRTSDAHYPVMSWGELSDLPVQSLAAEHAALFLWVPPPLLFDVAQRRIIEGWGFDYRTVAFLWVKRNRRDGRFATGMGHYTRANTEPCLLAVRGSMPVANRSVSQVVLAPRLRHSEKPVEVHRRIEMLYPVASKIELFARGPAQPGWDVWGDEAESGIDWKEVAG